VEQDKGGGLTDALSLTGARIILLALTADNPPTKTRRPCFPPRSMPTQGTCQTRACGIDPGAHTTPRVPRDNEGS